jgi:hypothetical protein
VRARHLALYCPTAGKPANFVPQKTPLLISISRSNNYLGHLLNGISNLSAILRPEEKALAGFLREGMSASAFFL